VRPLSLRLRLTLWYTLALVAAIGLFGVNVVWGERRIGLRRVDTELNDGVRLVTEALEQPPGGESPREAAIRARSAVTVPGTLVAIVDAQGAPLAGDLNRFPAAARQRAGRTADAFTADGRAGGWRVHRSTQTVDDVSMTIWAAQSLNEVRRAQHEVLEAIEGAIPLALLLAGGGGLWLASIGLRPITDMARRAADIPPTGTDDLGHADRPDELGQFARAFNALLARVRASLATQRQFMADASHELRTPVSVIRAASEVTLGKDERSAAEYREALTVAGAQARYLGRLVEQMLVLAKADAGGFAVRMGDVYLDEVLAECRGALAMAATERGVRMDWPPMSEIVVRGDEELLRQLLVNVLQNAVQHTPHGGQVSVDAEASPSAVRVRVRDTGPGIPPGDQERIFERFVQLDPARRHAGAGLGLPIARWIAEAHLGSLVLERSGPGGSTFLLTLPAPI
jgi:two-component system OmpR family sensor kinase